MEKLTTIAISKLVSSTSKEYKNARQSLEPGEYEIDTTLQIQGSIKVGEDYESTPTCSLLNQEFLMLVLHHAGITRSSALKILEQTATLYLKDYNGSAADKKAAKEARKQMIASFDPEGKVSEIFESFKESLPKIKSNGKVTIDCRVEELGQSDVTQLESIAPPRFEESADSESNVA